MEAFANIIKVSLPNYLKNLPLPNSFGALGKLTGDQWLAILPFLFVVSFLLYAVMKTIIPSGTKKPSKINMTVKKDNSKVVDLLEIEDLAQEKVCYCRCWKSKKFPICDGSHNDHNETTGDNIGPLVLKKKAKK